MFCVRLPISQYYHNTLLLSITIIVCCLSFIQPINTSTGSSSTTTCDFYIATTGEDTITCGGENTPCQTLSWVFSTNSTLQPNNIVCLQDGSYDFINLIITLNNITLTAVNPGMANMTVKEDILGSETGEIGIEIRVSSFSFTNLIITSSQQSSSSLLPPPPPTTTTIRNLIEIQSNMEELRIENITMEKINCKENLIFSNLTFSDSTFHISNLNLQNVNTALHFFQLTSTQNILIYNLSLLNSSSSSAFSLMFNNLSMENINIEGGEYYGNMFNCWSAGGSANNTAITEERDVKLNREEAEGEGEGEGGTASFININIINNIKVNNIWNFKLFNNSMILFDNINLSQLLFISPPSLPPSPPPLSQLNNDSSNNKAENDNDDNNNGDVDSQSIIIYNDANGIIIISNLTCHDLQFSSSSNMTSQLGEGEEDEGGEEYLIRITGYDVKVERSEFSASPPSLFYFLSCAFINLTSLQFTSLNSSLPSPSSLSSSLSSSSPSNSSSSNSGLMEVYLSNHVAMQNIIYEDNYITSESNIITIFANDININSFYANRNVEEMDTSLLFISSLQGVIENSQFLTEGTSDGSNPDTYDISWFIKGEVTIQNNTFDSGVFLYCYDNDNITLSNNFFSFSYCTGLSSVNCVINDENNVNNENNECSNNTNNGDGGDGGDEDEDNDIWWIIVISLSILFCIIISVLISVIVFLIKRNKSTYIELS